MCRNWRWAAIVSLALLGATHAAATTSARLRARVVDPVDARGIPGALVVMGPERGRTDRRGRLRLRAPDAGQEHLPVRVSAPGARRYETWVPTGERTRRRFRLFPRGRVTIPGDDGGIPGRLLLRHFDVVHRSPQSGEVVQRWVRQPRISIASHVVATSDEGGQWRMLATDRRLSGAVIRRIRDGIRAGIGPLSGGLLRPGAIRVRELSPGEIVGRSMEEVAPAGELVAYVHSRGYWSSGAGLLLNGDEVVGGFIYLDLATMSEHELLYDPFLLVHEFAHLFGMNHGSDGAGIGVPLCSIMRSGNCGDRALPAMPTLSVFDAITARLAYSRLPGNDRQDRDPVPATGAGPGHGMVRTVDGLVPGGRAPMPARVPSGS